MADKTFTDKQREIVARKMGYDGPMQMFDEFLMSRPSDAQRYASITSKFAENMAKGGVVGYKNLASKGRNGDTMLAHITPEEAALLKARGGAGTINPKTGLPEFFGLGSINWSQYTSQFPEPDAPPVLAQVFDPNAFKEVAGQLQKVTIPQQGFGYGVKPAYETIDPELDKYADRGFATGMGGGRQIEGYTVPTDKTFQGSPLVAKYDAKGNFIHVVVDPQNPLTPDPNQPNILATPVFNKTGGITNYGVYDANAQGHGGFGDFISELVTDLGPMILAAVGANLLGPAAGAAGGAAGGGAAALSPYAAQAAGAYGGSAAAAAAAAAGNLAGITTASELQVAASGAGAAAEAVAAAEAAAAAKAAAAAPGLGIKAATGTGLDLAKAAGTTVGDAAIKAAAGTGLDLAATTGGGLGITAGSAGASTIGA
jgi:hypothetical protein